MPVNQLLSARSLCLTPTVWWQQLLSGDLPHSVDEMKRLYFHAKITPENRRDWFNDPSLFDVPFTIDVLSDTTTLRRRGEDPISSEWAGTIGGLRYIDDPVSDRKILSSIYGLLSVNDEVFEDLWERVKFKGRLPHAVWLEVLGLESRGWDLKKQPKSKLRVIGVNFVFSTVPQE